MASKNMLTKDEKLQIGQYWSVINVRCARARARTRRPECLLILWLKKWMEFVEMFSFSFVVYFTTLTIYRKYGVKNYAKDEKLEMIWKEAVVA
jgi:hypothetical protein